MATPVSVVIITYNEEINLLFALKSVCGWADQVFIVDSFSTDKTVEIAKSYGGEVYQNAFQSYAAQRNWALFNLPIKNDWILFLDADEYLSHELKEEIAEILRYVPNKVNGFVIKRKFYFLGRWIKYGDICPSLIRITRKGTAYYINTGGYGREKVVVEGNILKLNNYIIHDDKKDIAQWITKQTIRASMDASQRLKISQNIKPSTTMINSKSRMIEELKQVKLRKLLYKIPRQLRPFAQFFYRYIIRLGFLDGWPGFIYHFLLQFWYLLMVEAIYEELKYRQKLADKNDVSY